MKRQVTRLRQLRRALRPMRPSRPPRSTGPARGSMISRGLLYLGVVTALVGVMCAQFAGAFEDYVRVKAKLTSAGDALVPGSDVKMRGVVIGRVGSIRRGEGPNDVTGEQEAEGLTSVLGTRGAVLELQLFKRFVPEIPATVTARSLPANFFGQAYVELVVYRAQLDANIEPILEVLEREQAEGEDYAIPQDHSLETSQLQEVFDKLYRVLTAIQPAKLQAALGALAEALTNRGDKLNSLIVQTDAYLRALEPGLPALRHDITAFADFAETLGDQDTQLLDSVDDLLVTARTLVERQQDLIALLGGGLNLTRNTSGLLSRNEERLVTVARQGRRIIGTFADHPNAFSDGFVDLGRFLGGLSTRGTGRIGLDTLIGAGQLRPYTAENCPRYPGLDGPNCPAAAPGPRRAAAPAPVPAAVGPSYGGTVGPVGSLSEKLTLGAILAALGRQQGATYGDVGVLLAGSLLRGKTVMLP